MKKQQNINYKQQLKESFTMFNEYSDFQLWTQFFLHEDISKMKKKKKQERKNNSKDSAEF